jgi:hypothetical protein
MGLPEIDAAIARVFTALRLMLETFTADTDRDLAAGRIPDVTALNSAVRALDSQADRYQLVAHLAMLVRWASVTTGRPEAEIVDMLERKDLGDLDV